MMLKFACQFNFLNAKSSPNSTQYKITIIFFDSEAYTTFKT